jgi:mono/diheme cytochrome c family protein
MTKHFLQVLLLCAVLTWIGSCDDLGDPASSDGGNGGGSGVSYTAQIQPIFNAHCISCHSSPASPTYGDLDLTSYAGLMDSVGTHAPVVVPGNPDASYLVRRIEGTVTPQMPQGGSPLSGVQIALIVQWIDEGALNN